jgi:SlyX protein
MGVSCAVRVDRGVLSMPRGQGQGGPFTLSKEEIMQERMEELEIKYLYLQKSVDELSSVVIEQQKEIRELRHMVALLGKKLRDVAAMPPFDPDEKPPHY